MAGYVSMDLHSTPSEMKPSIFLKSIINLLQNKYLLRHIFPDHVHLIIDKYTSSQIEEFDIKIYRDTNAVGVAYPWISIGGQLNVGIVDFWAIIYFTPFSTDDQRPVINIQLEPRFRDALYVDEFNNIINRSQKQSVIQFCVDVATAAQADGFVLRQHQEQTPVIDTFRIVSALTDPSSPYKDVKGDITGISTSKFPKDIITSNKGKGKNKYRYVFNNFLLVDLI